MPQIQNNPGMVAQVRGVVRSRRTMGLQLALGFVAQLLADLGFTDGSAIGAKNRFIRLASQGSSAAYNTTQKINTFLGNAEKTTTEVDGNNATRFNTGD